MISMILAMDKNNLVCKGNDLPWHYPEDLKYFKKVTLGKDVLMGYNTYLSIVNRLGKPLPKRINHVLTFEKDLPLGGKIVDNLDALLEEYQENDKELFIIGGKSIYELLVNKADRLYLTRINNEHEGDIYLNCFEIEKYKLISKEEVGILSFEVYEMK